MQKFNYHTHTYRCGHADVDYTDEDYIKDYIKNGFTKIAFTDHCPEKTVIDARPNVRMSYHQRHEYLDSIEKLKEKYKGQIEIQSGYEVEYLPGEEENLKELKNETDKLILGQHFIYNNDSHLKCFGYKKDEEFTDEELIRYVQYIEKAMEYHIVDIIAHPDIFMLNSEEFGEIEEKVTRMICKSAKKYNIPLEINLNRIFSETYYKDKKLNDLPIEIQKTKLQNVAYPCKEFWKIVSQYNVRVLYGLDVHHRGHIDLYNELVELANEIIGQETINKLKFIEDDI